MFTSEFAIRFMVDKRSAVSAKALLKFWIAVSVSAFMCSPPSPLLGSMSSSSGVSKSSSRDTGSRITERPAADLRYVEQGERDDQRGPLSESHHRDCPRPLASRRLDSRHNDFAPFSSSNFVVAPVLSRFKGPVLIAPLTPLAVSRRQTANKFGLADTPTTRYHPCRLHPLSRDGEEATRWPSRSS